MEQKLEKLGIIEFWRTYFKTLFTFKLVFKLQAKKAIFFKFAFAESLKKIIN
jgi:hypothetical protein